MDPTQHHPTAGQPARNSPGPKYGFRWSIFVGIPVAIAVFLFVLNDIEPSFQFEDVMRRLQVLYEDRYVRLAYLGVVCITVTVIVESSKQHPR